MSHERWIDDLVPGRVMWSHRVPDDLTHVLHTVDVTDHSHPDQTPYCLCTYDWQGFVVSVMRLNLEDLRTLHRALTDELARVATGGRWPGRERR